MAKFAKFKRLRRLNIATFAMRAAWLRLVRTQLPLGTIAVTPAGTYPNGVAAAAALEFSTTRSAAKQARSSTLSPDALRRIAKSCAVRDSSKAFDTP